MARTDPQFNLRVPAELKQQVEEAAKLSGRSINAEAVYRLEQSFKNINKSLDDLSADELIYFIFNKLNSRGLHLTVEEVARIKKYFKSTSIAFILWRHNENHPTYTANNTTRYNNLCRSEKMQRLFYSTASTKLV